MMLDRTERGSMLEAKSIPEWCKAIHTYALDHGWWETERPFPEIIATIHSEASEAFERYRDHWHCQTIKYVEGKPEGIPIELADIVIRIMDYCARAGIDLEDAVQQKHRYNLTRPYRHGGKRA